MGKKKLLQNDALRGGKGKVGGGGQREGVWGSGNVSNNMVLLKYQMVS